MVLFLKMLAFFILIVVGYISRQFGMITRENQTQLSALAMNVTCPALILSGAFVEGPRISLTYAAEVMGWPRLCCLWCWRWPRCWHDSCASRRSNRGRWW